MNTKNVADAIAARFTGITAAGEALTVGPTASLPNAIAKGPALLVYPPVGDLSIGMTRSRDDALTFAVRLLRDPLDVPARTDALYAWYDAMRDLIEMNMDLDLAYVAWASPISMRAELDGIEYAAAVFDVVELLVKVQFNEYVATIAI
jgi:hypothetical protein